MLRRLLAPGRAAGGDFVCDICTNICAKKRQQSTSRTSKRRVSCLGMPWIRNEPIILTFPNPGVACTVCYFKLFVQPTANTKTCSPINSSAEYRKAPFNVFSATASRRKVPEKKKIPTASSKRHQIIFVDLGE